MTIVLNIEMVAFIFQPEFPNLFFSVISNGKTWVIVILGSLLSLIPDFLYETVCFIFFPDPSQVAMQVLKSSDRKLGNL